MGITDYLSSRPVSPLVKKINFEIIAIDWIERVNELLGMNQRTSSLTEKTKSGKIKMKHPVNKCGN